MSTRRSRYSKIRSKSASELWTSIEIESRLPIGAKRRAWSVVNATSVPIVIAVEPCESAKPPTQYTAAGMNANTIWIDAIIQRPVIRLRTSSPASRLRLALEPLGELLRAAHRLAEQDPGDRERLLDERRDVGHRLLPQRSRSCAAAPPTLRVIHTKSGISASANSASRQSSRNIAITTAITVVTVETTEVAVEVRTLSTPPMSFAIRLCTSPVRVRVKNASESRWRWR